MYDLKGPYLKPSWRLHVAPHPPKEQRQFLLCRHVMETLRQVSLRS